jgi:glutamate/tyrosine decarboxylase-like PLP-dependent enzyme
MVTPCARVCNVCGAPAIWTCGLAELVNHCCENARALVEGIGQLPGAEIVWKPQINQGLVKFLNPAVGANELDHDRFTDEVIQQVLRGGEAFFMGTTWHGRRAMRVSVLSWQTSHGDVERAIAAVRRALPALRDC